MKFSQFLQPAASNRIPKFKNLTRQYEAATGWRCEEYRLVAIPPNLKTFAILCNYQIHPHVVRLVWITDHAFVTWNEHELVWPWDNEPLTLAWKVNDGRYNYCRLYSPTVEGLNSGLELLVGLPDNFFTRMRITECAFNSHLSSKEIFFTRLRGSLRPSLIEMLLLQNPKREIVFQGMHFTPEQLQVLATAGTRTCLVFQRCQCLDGGLAFAKASASRNDPDAGPAHLILKGGQSPFREEYLEMIFKSRNLDSLVLREVSLGYGLAGCQALALAARTLRKLEIQGCNGVFIGTSRDVLFSSYSPFRSPEQFAPLLTSLSYNERLQSLDLYLPCLLRNGQIKDLASALAQNKSLQYLSLGWWNGHIHNVRGGWKWGWEHWQEDRWEDWNALMQALLGHESIQTLDLSRTDAFTTDLHGPIMDVACMLKENKQMDRILRNDSTRHRGGYWDDLVVPLLDCNKYRKLMQKIQTPHTRAAVMVKALEMVSCQPSVTWMLLCQNCDVVSNYLSCIRGG